MLRDGVKLKDGVNIWGRRRHIVRLYPRWGEHLAMDHPYRPSHIHLCDALGASFAQAGDHGGILQL